MKILYIAPLSRHRNQGTGGVETATENILEGFSRIKGLEVIFLSFRSEYSPIAITKYSDNITIIQKGHLYNFKFLNIFLYQRKEIRKIIDSENPDLIHFHGTGPNILSISHLQKDKIIITQHGIMRIELKYQTTFRNMIRFLFKSIVEKIYFPKFLNYIFISNNNLNFAKKYYKPKFFNYTVIPNSVNMEFFRINPKKETDNKILYVGFISRLKNTLELIKTINELKNINKIFKLIIVGKIKDYKYYEECRTYITDNDLTNCISFEGFLNQKELVDLYNDIDIFVLPSLQENTPISLLEAMAAGKVSVATKIGGIPEIVKTGKTGYIFENNNSSELFTILSQLYNNPLLLNSIGENARKYIIEKHSTEHIARLTYKYYKFIINN